MIHQSIEELQNRVHNQSGQLAALNEAQQRSHAQLSELITAQKEAQQRSHEQLSELITGLSFQMTQLKERSRETGGNGGSGSSNGGNGFSRLSRVDFPKFDGEDVQGWLYKCEQFFEIDAIPGNRRVKIASIHLSGRALVWHQSFMRGFGLGVWPEWEEYKRAIVDRFGVGPYDDPLAELMKLKQGGSVAQYQEKFDLLLNRVDLSMAQAGSCFLSGLNEEVRCAVRMFRPTNCMRPIV